MSDHTEFCSMKLVASNVINEIMNDEWGVCWEKRTRKRKHTVGLEPTISCSVGKRLIQLGYACLQWLEELSA